jgi:hypothetical protein
VASKEIGLEVNADKTKCLVMSRDQTAGQSHNVYIEHICSESVEDLKYLGTTLSNQKSVQEDMKSGFISGNDCRIFCLPFCYPKV